MKSSGQASGTPGGGDHGVLFECTVLVAIMPIGLWIGGASWHDPLARIVLGLYELPLVMAGALLVDPHPIRRKIYSYGGLAAISGLVLSLF